MCDYSFLNFEGSLGVIDLQIIFYLHVLVSTCNIFCNCDYSFTPLEGSLGVIELQIIFYLHAYMYLHVIFFLHVKIAILIFSFTLLKVVWL